MKLTHETLQIKNFFCNFSHCTFETSHPELFFLHSQTHLTRKNKNLKNKSIQISQIQHSDLTNGFLETLNSLKSTSGLTLNDVNAIFNEIKNNPHHLIFVAKTNQSVIGTATLIIEHKFTQNGYAVGHIEDVAIRKDFQKKGIGKKLIRTLIEEAKIKKCYKVVLNCAEKNVLFYEKIGFNHHLKGMRLDLN